MLGLIRQQGRQKQPAFFPSIRRPRQVGGERQCRAFSALANVGLGRSLAPGKSHRDAGRERPEKQARCRLPACSRVHTTFLLELDDRQRTKAFFFLSLIMNVYNKTVQAYHRVCCSVGLWLRFTHKVVFPPPPPPSWPHPRARPRPNPCRQPLLPTQTPISRTHTRFRPPDCDPCRLPLPPLSKPDPRRPSPP